MPQLIERVVERQERLPTGAEGPAAGAQHHPEAMRRDSTGAEIPAQPPPGALGAPAPGGPARFAVPYESLRRRGFISPASSGSKLSEEIRLVKRQLMKLMDFERREHDSRTILVTSARAGEGKSFVALNLALSFALDERMPALIVDADHARAATTRLLSVPREPGLMDALLDGAPLAALLRRGEDLALSVLPPGRPLPSATALFGSRAMNELLREARRHEPGSVIVIDAPPLLATTEAMELAPRAEQILVVVEAEATSEPAIKSALNLVEGCANVSLVLNKAPRFAAAGFGDYAHKAG